jgi:hypothetical protein
VIVTVHPCTTTAAHAVAGSAVQWDILQQVNSVVLLIAVLVSVPAAAPAHAHAHARPSNLTGRAEPILTVLPTSRVHGPRLSSVDPFDSPLSLANHLFILPLCGLLLPACHVLLIVELRCKILTDQ